ncbi:MAG: hypothetical protein ACK53L_04530 [Pirellulaceae bacterium]
MPSPVIDFTHATIRRIPGLTGKHRESAALASREPFRLPKFKESTAEVLPPTVDSEKFRKCWHATVS